MQIAGPRHMPPGRGPGPLPAIASPATYAIGQMMSQWSDANWNDFWSGNIFYTAFNRTTGGPSDSRTPGPPPLLAFVRYDAFGSHGIDIAQPPQGRMPSRPGDAGDDLSGDLAQTKFGKAVLAWPDITEAEKDDAFSLPIKAVPGQSDREEFGLPYPSPWPTS